MKLFKRISATVAATVDHAVSQVENHEAIVDAGLKETQVSIARARVQFARVQKDGAQLRQKLETLERQASQWEQRAIGAAEHDEETALQCIQRRNQCTEQLSQTRTSLVRHKELEGNLEGSVQRMESRLQTLTQQRNMLRSRHSAADAMRVINSIESQSNYGIDDTFERWEARISESEYMGGVNLPVDTLDASFAKIETEQVLRAQLGNLLDKSTNSDKDKPIEGANNE